MTKPTDVRGGQLIANSGRRRAVHVGWKASKVVQNSGRLTDPPENIRSLTSTDRIENQDAQYRGT